MKYRFEVELYSKNNVEWGDILHMLISSGHFKNLECYCASVKPIDKVDEE